MRLRRGSASSEYSNGSMSDCSSSSSSISSIDEDEVNCRVYPCWKEYRALIQRRGYRLDTNRDVKEFYERHWDHCRVDCLEALRRNDGYIRACNGRNDELCPDAGLPGNLFRGTRIRDGKKVMVKAVHIRSRELDVIRTLSSSPLRGVPMNHTIPVLDFIEVLERDMCFIVQEEWSSQLQSSLPNSLRGLLRVLRQCIEGLVFMHANRIAHLDISVSNVLTDDQGRYNYIDFEMSRRFDDYPECDSRSSDSSSDSSSRSSRRSGSGGSARTSPPRVGGCRGTEIPPDVEGGEESCPFKVDIWALGILILKACKLTGFDIPELVFLTGPMLQLSSEARPTARAVLHAFDRVEARILSKLHPRA